MTSSFDIIGHVKHPCHMADHSNEQHHETDRHRRWRMLWAIAVILAAAAVVVNILVVNASQTGFLIPVFVAVFVALCTENRGSACGRRHAK
jgi:hypothetical protein